MKLLLLLIFIYCAIGKDIILFAGIGNWSDQYLYNQYSAYRAYANMEMINTASILTYFLNTDGMMGVYQSDIDNHTCEEFQYTLKKDFGLKALPCLFCDATIGVCSNLGGRLEKLFARKYEFINDTITRALKYGWYGYSVDFEPDTDVNSTELTNFMIEWGNALQKYNLILSIWIGGPTPYKLDTLLRSDAIRVITMDTYTSGYGTFIDIAGQLIIMTNMKNVGFGLLAYPTQYDDILRITKWIAMSKVNTLGIWASTIPPEWYEAVFHYADN